MSMDNPIRKINGVTVPTPSSCTYNLADVSAADSGRTQDGMMHKNRIGQAVTINLSWQNIDTNTAHQIISLFNPEYIMVEYYDLLQGAYVTKQFYVGDRSAPMYSAVLDLWQNVSFNIIQRSVK